MGLATEGPDSLLSDSVDPVKKTILNTRASSTRLQYQNRWKLFSAWCTVRNEDPIRCSVPIVLEFLQSLLDQGWSPSTLRVCGRYFGTACHGWQRHNREPETGVPLLKRGPEIVSPMHSESYGTCPWYGCLEHASFRALGTGRDEVVVSQNCLSPCHHISKVFK